LSFEDDVRARELYLANIALNEEWGRPEMVNSESATWRSLAARMVGFTDSAYAGIGQVPDPDDAEELSKVRAAAVTALGDAGFAAAYQVGAG